MNDSWLVYLNIESEVIEAFNYVYFCDSDSQMNVYSRKFAELLLRICIEIETLSKEIYYQNGGFRKSKLYFDTDCISHLENVFRIKNKIVNISYPYFDCKNAQNKKLMPLSDFYLTDNREWQKAYQDIKHDRLKNAKKATLKNVIHSLAALYLLNIYNRNEKHTVHFNDIINYDTRFGSSLFSIEPPISKDFLLYNPNNEGAVYEITMRLDSQKKSNDILNNYCKKFKEYTENQPESSEKDFIEKFNARKYVNLSDYSINFINLLYEYKIDKELKDLSAEDKVIVLKNKYIAHKIDGRESINTENFEKMKQKYLRIITGPIIHSFENPVTSFNLYNALYDLKIIRYV